MKLNQAVSVRLQELLHERGMTQYQLYLKSGVPKSTIGNLLHCSYDSVKLRVLHELCQGLGLSFPPFFPSPLCKEDNLDSYPLPEKKQGPPPALGEGAPCAVSVLFSHSPRWSSARPASTPCW